MTDTVISSASREVVIGFDRPFVIIGERINPTGRKLLAAAMAAGETVCTTVKAVGQLFASSGVPSAVLPSRSTVTLLLKVASWAPAERLSCATSWRSRGSPRSSAEHSMVLRTTEMMDENAQLSPPSSPRRRGSSLRLSFPDWIPAFAGMTVVAAARLRTVLLVRQK